MCAVFQALVFWVLEQRVGQSETGRELKMVLYVGGENKGPGVWFPHQRKRAVY